MWFRFHQGAIEIVIAKGDAKLGHLERMPGGSLTVFAMVPHFEV